GHGHSEDQAALGIQSSRLRNHGTGRQKVVDEALIGSKENVRGSAVLDLLGQVARRAHDQRHTHARGLLEERLDFPKSHVKVCGCIDGDGLWSRLCTHGPYGGQYHREHKEWNPSDAFSSIAEALRRGGPAGSRSAPSSRGT